MLTRRAKEVLKLFNAGWRGWTGAGHGFSKMFMPNRPDTRPLQISSGVLAQLETAGKIIRTSDTVAVGDIVWVLSEQHMQAMATHHKRISLPIYTDADGQPACRVSEFRQCAFMRPAAGGRSLICVMDPVTVLETSETGSVLAPYGCWLRSQVTS